MIHATARGMQHQNPTHPWCFHSIASPDCHVSHCVLRTWQAVKVVDRAQRQPRAPLQAPDQSVRKMVNMNSEIDGMDENLELAGVFNGPEGALVLSSVVRGPVPSLPIAARRRPAPQ